MPESGKFVKVIRDEHTTWKYDINGRLVEKVVDKGGYRPLLWRYRWDARSQLTGLEAPEGERWEYKYDPFGRRISKRCINRDKPGMDFHWNGDQLTEEIPVSPDGTPVHENAIRWICEPGSFTPLARYEKGQLHYAVTDTVGRVQELVTEDGTIIWQGKQQLWGREESGNKENIPSCRLRFPGQYEDEESGLYYNRFRYYDCGTGQYLCSDPVGLRGGLNSYAYVPNPLSWIDPLGLSCKSSYSGKLSGKASEMNPLVRGSKAWNQAIKDMQAALSRGEKFQVKVQSSTDAKAFLQEAQGNMNRYKAHTQSARPDGVPKYPKGYEQHMGPEGGFGDSPHIKWYNNGTDGHIFYDIPN
ncbi:RHS repeat-associated core domain-containing protein [Citrobacter sp. wls827]|uniref:RHS repeat domain-containing protein n=1 Tax=Citrobacter sp. wls827 TaxID=2576414 RepID=UPI002017DA68|nr:RHS repeat-associated core domain-containing protein [Citrobacter sp. wls827]